MSESPQPETPAVPTGDDVFLKQAARDAEMVARAEDDDDTQEFIEAVSVDWGDD